MPELEEGESLEYRVICEIWHNDHWLKVPSDIIVEGAEMASDLVAKLNRPRPAPPIYNGTYGPAYIQTRKVGRWIDDTHG